MIQSVIEFVHQNQASLNSLAGFMTGACLIHLVIARTLRKRQREAFEAEV